MSHTPMSKSTPGPWTWDGFKVIGPDKRSVLELDDDGACGDPECCGAPSYYINVSDANARLIAAAPELLQALKDLKGHCFCGYGIGNPMYRDHSQACKQATAALAKAEGAPEAREG